MKAVVAAFNQEKALVGAFSVIVQPVEEPMDRFTATLHICFIHSLSPSPFTTPGPEVGRQNISIIFHMRFILPVPTFELF